MICSKQIHLRYKEKKTKRKRHHFLIEGIWKGYLFLSKVVYKRVRGWPWPCNTLLSTPFWGGGGGGNAIAYF